MSGENPDPGAAKTLAAHQYLAAVDASNRGDWHQALPLLRGLVATGTTHASIHHLLSVAALATGHHGEAVEHSEIALSLEPGNGTYLLNATLVISRAQSPQRALETAHRAESRVWNDGRMCMQLSALYSKANAYEAASRLSARARELLPDDARCTLNHATTLVFDGNMEAAEQAYERVIELEPAYARAHFGLAQLKTWGPGSGHLDRLRALLSASRPGEDRMYLLLAMSKELDDSGAAADAFKYLVAGKREGRALAQYRPDTDRALFDALMSGPAGTDCDDEGNPTTEPIFVMGMPRTGTTLVERILSSHTRVQAAGELLNFPIQAKRASGTRSRRLIDTDTIRALRVARWRCLGDEYISSTRPLTGKAPHFVDKHPHNFLYMAMIARAFPRARIICLRRNPLDTCLSNFRQLFSHVSPFHGYSFDLMETGRYYLRFRSLMAHFERELRDRVLWLDYEGLVADQEAETRRMLDFCRLPWEPDCLQFERNAAPVATASAPQVRSSLHRESVGRWRRFAAEIEPLRACLRAGGVPACDLGD